jgi:Contractile injection system tube protein
LANINRGTLILLAPNAEDASISQQNIFFIFQYNPEKLLHTFNQSFSSAIAPNTLDPPGFPVELFNLTFELDSTDLDPPSQNQTATNFGIHPALAMLELMMQPQVVGKQPSLPIVVFKWGSNRSVPVRLISISVEEQSFDAILNPTRAVVSLTLRVLGASEVNGNPGAQSIFSSHQGVRATLVDAYKLQTGQATFGSGVGVASASGVSSAGGSVALGLGIRKKSA